MTIAQTTKSFSVIASVAKQSSFACASLDCFVAVAPRNDGLGEYA